MTEGLNYLLPGPSAVSTVVGDRGHVVDPCYTATWRTCESDVGSQLVTLLLFLALPLPLLARVAVTVRGRS